jgi:spore coat protein CotH
MTSPAIRLAALLLAVLLASGLTSCGDTTIDATAEAIAASANAVLASTDGAVTEEAGVFDSTFVHAISVAFDEDDYAALIETYATTGEKEWIEATVVIDGVTFERVGMRLKGNSSLFGLLEDSGGRPGPSTNVSAEEPESLPWLIRLDKYVEGQNYGGVFDLVVRSNNSETSLNEAVALDLLELAGLASQEAIMTSFSVNGSDSQLRLVIEHPDDGWLDANFEHIGALYKAESTGDYTYRGDDPDAYDEVFDQEAGKSVTDLSPLIEFLEFINDADDEAFVAEIDDRLDVDAFATYLAMQELIDNFDDIDGPGNNSYLYYDAEADVFTVVAWDHNLAFGSLNGAGDVDDPRAEGRRGMQPGGPGGALGGENVLVERFLAIEQYATLVRERQTELTSSLFASGGADEVLEAWVAVVESSGLVAPATVAEEVSRIAAYFDIPA